MRVRNVLQTVVFGMVFAIGLATAHGAIYDAYADFHTTGNNASATWQYGSSNAGTLGIYALYDAHQLNGLGYNMWMPGWAINGYMGVGRDPAVTTELRVMPDVGGFSADIGWKSPEAATADVTFSVTDQDPNPGYDGVEYYLMKGDGTVLSHDVVDAGGTSGIVSVSGIAVSIGDMLYLQIAPGASAPADLTGVNFTVTTTVPEPSTLALLGTALFGLLAYAWRRRK